MKYFLVLVAFLPSFAFAQQKVQPPMEQALSQKLGEEINMEMQFREALISERAKNAELQKQLDDLKPKAETSKSIEPVK